MKFIFNKLSSKKFSKLSENNQNRIIEKLEFLKKLENIFFYLKKLENFYPATHRIRVWSIRLVLEYDKEIDSFYILDVWNRWDIYK